jgi:hypothetical protein
MPHPAAILVTSSPQRQAKGNLMQPASQRFTGANGRRLACQNEECRLERILGVLHVSQDAPAGREYHWAVKAHDLGKRRFVLRVYEGLD